MKSQFLLRKLLCFLLLAYSCLHFFSSSGIRPGSAIGGDFLSGFPSFWAWKLNPNLIQGNPSVQGWMGLQHIQLNENFCKEKEFDFRGKELMDTLVQPPRVCKKYLSQKVEGDLTPLTPLVVENRTWQYGPMMHFFTFPLLYIDNFKSALRVWHTVVALLFLFLLYLWYDMLYIKKGRSSFVSFTLFAALWLNFSPAYDVLKGAEIEIVEFLFLTLFIRLLLKGDEMKAGIALAFSVAVKYTPLIFLPYLIWRKKFKAVLSSCVCMGLLWTLTQLTLGWEWSYTLRILQKMGSGTTATGSQSFSSLIYRLFTHFDLFHDSTATLARLPVTNPELAFLVTKVFLCCVILFYSVFFLVRPGEKVSLFELSLISIFMVTITQWNHIYYLIFLLIGYSAALSYLSQTQKKTGKLPKLESGLLFFSFLLVGYFFPSTIYHHIFALFGLNFWDTYTVLSIPVYGYTILMVWLTVKIMLRSSKSGSEPTLS